MIGNHLVYGYDGEVRAHDTSSDFELNFHPDTPEHVELGGYAEGEYEVFGYFTLADLKALVEAAAEVLEEE
mgnify:FL=1